MKKYNKILTALLSLGLVGASSTLAGCDLGKTKVTTEQMSANCTVNLTNTTLSLCVGETVLLGANLSGGSYSDVLVYKSTDSSVITVNEYGFVKALKPGKAEIRAIYGTAIDKCSVEVSLKDNVATIQLKNILDKSINIDKSTHITLEPAILYNNDYYDFNASYSLSDYNIATIEGDTFIPLKNGTVYLTVSGTFFGTSAISTTIEIVISDNLIIYMKDSKGIEKNDVYLYSVGQNGTESYDTEFTPSCFGVIRNGQEINSPNLNIQLVDEDGILNFDQTTLKVSSKSKVGVAQYVVTYYDEKSDSHVKTFNIYSNKSVFTSKTGLLETDIYGADLPVNEIFKDFESKEIVKATSLDGKTEYIVEDGKVKGLPTIRDEISGEVLSNNYIIYNNIVGFIVSIKTYTKILKTAEDLNYFRMTTISDKFNGYYVLDNDIDGLSGENYFRVDEHVRTMGGSYNSYPGAGLIGVFDGRGHSIKHISVGEGGLFGNIGNGGTIKNVSIEDVKFRLDGLDDTPILCTYMNGGILENVHISNSYIAGKYNTALISCNIMNNCLFRNCYFRLQISDSDMGKITSPNFGVLGSMCGQKNNLTDGFTSVFKNTVINSNIPLIVASTNTYNTVAGERVKAPFICDVEGHHFTVDEGVDEFLIHSDITRFYTDQEMSLSGNQFEAFDNNYWHVDINGMLVWGTLN